MNLRRGLLFFLVWFVFWAGCSSRNSSPPPSAISRGGIVKISASAETETLDPQKILFLSDMQIARFIFEGLVGVGPDFQPFPLLCEGWEKSPDGRVIHFRLRKNIRFQDDPCFPGGIGRTLTAEDVRFTFRRIADPKVRCPNWYLFEGKIVGIDRFHAGKSAVISGIRVLAPTEIEFHLTKPYFSFLKLLATIPAQIVPHEAVETYGVHFGRDPVGTGPFRLARWKPLKEIFLVRNDHYWQKAPEGGSLPYLEGVHIQLLSNPVLKTSEFLKGNLDVIHGKKSDLSKLRKQPDFQKRFRVSPNLPDLGIRFFGFSLDTHLPLSQDPKIRQAIVRAFQREKITETNPNAPRPATSLVPSLFWKGTRFSWYPYSPKTARHLLAGVKVPLQNRPIVISSNIQTPEVDGLCQAIRALGLRCSVDLRPVKYYAHILKDRPDIFRVSFMPSYPDPEEYDALFYSKNKGGVNLTGYQNLRFDRLLEKAWVEQNEAVRQALLIQMEKILARDIPAIYLFQTPTDYLITTRRLHALHRQPAGLDFRAAWIEREHGPLH